MQISFRNVSFSTFMFREKKIPCLKWVEFIMDLILNGFNACKRMKRMCRYIGYACLKKRVHNYRFLASQNLHWNLKNFWSGYARYWELFHSKFWNFEWHRSEVSVLRCCSQSIFVFSIHISLRFGYIFKNWLHLYGGNIVCIFYFDSLANASTNWNFINGCIWGLIFG